MFRLMRGAMALDDAVFTDMKVTADPFKRGLMILLVVGLLVGLVDAAVDFYQRVVLSPPPGSVTLADLERSFEDGFEQFQQFMPLPPATQDWVRAYARAGMQIAVDIANLDTALPWPTREGLKALGAFVSRPFAWLSLVMLYGVLVHIGARLFLQGRGTIQQMLGCTSLAAMPLVLNVLGPVPYLGPLAAFVAFWWSYAIYVQGTAAAQEFGAGKAALAVLLPVLIFVFIVLLIVALVGAFSALTGWA